MIGVLALTTLIVHGANFIAVKTENELNALNARSRGISRIFAFATVVLATPATFQVRNCLKRLIFEPTSSPSIACLPRT